MFSKFPHVIACVGISFLLCLSNMDVGLPGGSEVKNPLASAGDTDSILGQEDPLEKGMASAPLPEEFHEQRSRAGYSPWKHKKLDTTV